MPFVTPQELLDLAIMILALGFIFKDAFPVRVGKDYDPLAEFKSRSLVGRGFVTAIIVTVPAVALHELGHKIAALSFGLQATFHAAYTWLGIGIVLKLVNAPFIFFVPGYVSYSGAFVHPLARALIAFAGPLVNLVLFAAAALALRQQWFSSKYDMHLTLTKHINLLLLIFNMIPLPGFDGSHIASSVLQMLG